MSGKERLDVLVVQRGLAETRTKAQARILAGEVVVDDKRIDKPGTKFGSDADVRLKAGVAEKEMWVGRGAHKLLGAFDAWTIAVEGRTCVDVGASTGGFTEVLLRRGAEKVFAVDVGHNQLAWKLRQDPRVDNLEKTHIVKMEAGRLRPPPSLAVIDVSFISLDLVLPALGQHLESGSDVIALIKPQFEVGRQHVGKGGIVRDEEARQAAIDRVLKNAEQAGYTIVATTASPIAGTDGNIEWLAHLQWRKAMVPA